MDTSVHSEDNKLCNQKQKQDRTMKTTIQGFIAFLSLLAFASADTSPVNVSLKAGVAINQPLSAGSASSWKSKITPAQNAVPHNINRLCTALQIEFQSATGTPVDVSDVKFGRFEYTLIQNGVVVWNNVSIGSYHPAPQGSPDYYVYNVAGNEVAPTSGYVAGYLGDNSGATIPSMSRFQLLDQTISLGTPDRPLLTMSGHYYSLVYNITLSYTYGGVGYTKTFTPAETEVLVRMTDGLMEYAAPTSNEVPCLVELQVSCDMVNWFTAPNVVIPCPRPTPTQLLNTINLVPATTAVPGLPTNRQRLYRYAQVPITLLASP